MTRYLTLCLATALACGGCDRDFDEPPQPGVVLGTLVIGTQAAVPVPDARVRLVECGLSAISDAEGTFRFDEVPRGDFTLRVESDDYVLEITEVVVREGVRDLGQIELARAGWVSGTVSLQGGGTVLNSVVYVVGGDELTHAADDGSFRLEGVTPGARTISAARPGTMPSAPVEVVVRSGEGASADIELSPIPAGATASVSGTAILGNPGPEAGVLVTLTERFSSTMYSARTEDDGRFAIADVPAGYYELLASCEGYRSAGLPNLELRPDQELVLPTVVLPPGDSGTPAQPADADPNGRLDDDGDGHPDSEDNCPVVPNPAQRDEDSDGVGDACEREPPPSDLDWDYVPNERDNCPEVFNPDQANADDDPLGDACDPDDDNDGILDAADRCPLIADPNNRPELCTWPSPLVYSGQDQETGDIHLYSVVMKPEGGERQRLTHAPGQAWGAEVALDVSNTWLYFHHRASDTDHFEICRIDLELAREQEIVDLQDYCHDWGGDAMNPAVCGDDLLYDWFDTDHWVVRAVPIDGLSLGGQDLTPEVLPDHQRTYSVRYASCGEELRVGFYSLGLSVDHDLSAGTDLKWTFMTDAFESPNAISGPIVYDPDASSHQLRSCPGSYGSWYLESERGARADILFIPIQSGYEEKVVDGAHNREPDYLIIDLEMDTGLLAYQSDLYGSVDVFVRDPNSSTAVRVTKSDGWEGSPSWVPLPL